MSFDSTAPLVTGGRGDPAHDVLLGPGAVLGRYVVVHRIGEGTGGVVYAAYDSQLGRKVALKVIPTEVEGISRAGSESLLREAQLIAALDHPNIVTVHDVGVASGSTFIAMELVVGRDMAAWLADPEQQGGWSRRLAPWLLAGRGLAAAHEGGVIHGDFKPANVLIGDDGRVRVSDFGVGRPTSAEEVTAEGDEPERPGRLCGTPLYMAPELFGGAPPTVLSDVYSFAAAVFESLYERPPVSGKSIPELLGAKLQRPTIPVECVPRRIRTALRAALDPDPERRPRTARLLLDQLSAGAWWRKPTTIAVGGAALVSAGAYVAGSEPPTELCAGGAASVAEVWSTARRAETQDAFGASGVSYAAATWGRIQPALDDHAEAWAQTYEEVCEATQRGEQSAPLLDAKMGCLRAQLAGFDGLVSAFAAPTPDMVARAARAVANLPKPAICRDVDGVNPQQQPPHEKVEDVRVVDDTLARVHSLLQLGDVEGGDRAAQAALGQARALAFDPLIARALWSAGQAKLDGGEWDGALADLRAAALLAEQYGDDQTAAEAGLSVMFCYTGPHIDSEAALEWAPHVEVSLKRANVKPSTWARFHTVTSIALLDLGKRSEAREALTRAEVVLGDGDATVSIRSMVQSASAGLYRASGNTEQALVASEQVAAAVEEALGAGHPDVVFAQAAVADAKDDVGDVDGAINDYQHVLETAEASLGVAHPKFTTLRFNYANVLLHAERFDEAIQIMRETLPAFEASLGRDHQRYAFVVSNLAAALGRAGRHQESVVQGALAVELLEAHFPPDHRVVGYALGTYGAGLRNAGRFEVAVPVLERALAIRIAQPEGAADLAELQFALARCLVGADGDRVRARALAESALVGFETDGVDEAVNTATAWLREPANGG